MSKKIIVVDWISYDEANSKEESIGGMGGFFNFQPHLKGQGKEETTGMRWKDYLESFKKEVHPYAEAIRESVLELELWQGGDYHQNAADGVPLFSDGTVGCFSYRAWGDIMAAIWSEKLNRDFCYMNFYMDATLKDYPVVREGPSL